MNRELPLTQEESPDSELLVAYLDGEVSDAERQDLERRLANDASLREQLAGLQKSWHLLDRLSTAHADDAFTRTTISMAVQSAREVMDHPAVPASRRGRQAAIIALAALLGFLIVRLPCARPAIANCKIYPSPTNSTCTVMRIVSNSCSSWTRPNCLVRSPMMSCNDRRLPYHDWSARQVAAALLLSWCCGALLAETVAGTSQLGLLTDPRQIAEVIEQMSPADRQVLQERQLRFAAESESKQTAYRRLHRELAATPQADSLLRTLRNYCEWLATLSPSQRAELIDLPPQERIARIRQLKERQTQDWLREHASGITRSDAAAVLTFFRGYMDRNQDAILRQLPVDLRERIERMDNKRMRLMMLGTLVSRGEVERLPPIRPEEFTRLENALSSEARALWDRAGDDASRRELISSWMRAIISRSFQAPAVSPEVLEEFYLTRLSAEQQDALNQLPPDEMARRLRELYFRMNFGPPEWRAGEPRRGRRGDGWWGRPPGGPPLPGPPAGRPPGNPPPDGPPAPFDGRRPPRDSRR